MIFVFDSPLPHSVGNHDVRFPVDAIFLDHDGVIAGISELDAYRDAATPQYDSQFIIELNAGAAASLNLKPGDRVPLPPDLMPAPMAVTQMSISGRSFVLEKATTPAQQELGLMCRPTLAADHGMFFGFATESGRTFWNHDVHFPLDLLFMDSQARITGIRHMAAYDDTATDAVDCRYVIELNLGVAGELHLKQGDTLTLPADVFAAN
jgi:uncharacterized membrane protein (UPF0127 family)